MRLPTWFRRSAPAMRLWAPALALATCVVPAACSSADGPGKAALPTGDERDTELEHESCNGESSSARKVDVNGDGKPDIIHVMNGPREACRIVDLNFDGAVDAFIYYDPAGKERRRESDFDRDGRADEIAYLSGGVVVRKERETNFDNKIDTWDYYESGRLVRRERDSDGDGIVDQWWQFSDPNNPKCAVVASDRNADGKPDPESVVDLCGQSYGSPTLPPGAPPPPPAAADAGAPAASDAGAPAAADAGAAPAPTFSTAAASDAGASAAPTSAGDAGVPKAAEPPKK